MTDWTYINTEKDIEFLLKKTLGFHDSCLVALNYISGNYTDNSAMYFGETERAGLRAVFHSDWYENALEIIFEDVRRFNVAGAQKRYLNEILECSLSIRNDLDKFCDEKLILWTDGGYPKQESVQELLKEPICTYIIAGKMRWRMAELKYKCPCCGYYTFHRLPGGTYDACQICCWIDEEYNYLDMDTLNTSNNVSLKCARKNYLNMSACTEEFVGVARKPGVEELEGIDWI